MFFWSAVALTAVVLIAFLADGLRPRDPGVSAHAAEAAALRWTDHSGVAQNPRRDDDEWEVDVVRRNGSLVEVTIGDRLELRGLDEELGPNRSPAADELAGPARTRAIRAASAVVGSGRVLSVERDSPLEIEVNIRRPGDGIVEVALDEALRLVEVEPEDQGDE